MKTKILIIEDMALTRASLEDKLFENDYIVVGSFPSAEAGWQFLQQHNNIDMVLLDINLAGEKDGIWLANKIRENYHIPIVFLTAYGDSQTLEKVTNTKPNGYLMKPFNEPTLLTTLNIALQNFNATQNTKETQNQDFIYIKDSNTLVKIHIVDILYIQSDGNYLHLFLPHKKHLIRSKMDDFCAKLNRPFFIKVHHRFVVNIHKIEQLNTDTLTIQNFSIPLAAKYKERVVQMLKG